MDTPSKAFRVDVDSVPQSDLVKFQKAAQELADFVEQHEHPDPDADEIWIRVYAAAVLVEQGLDSELAPVLIRAVHALFLQRDAAQNHDPGHA